MQGSCCQRERVGARPSRAGGFTEGKQSACVTVSVIGVTGAAVPHVGARPSVSHLQASEAGPWPIS